MSSPSKSSKRWLKEHFDDPFVKKAQQSGYRSRAVFKLIEIQERDHLFKPGMTIVDLGAAPGGWSQYVSKLVMPKGKVIALDILPMEPIMHVDFIERDFTEDAAMHELLAHLSGRQVDWVLSDMAPNMSGNATIDIPRSLYLAELALDFAMKVSHTQSGLLLKVFQGEGFDQFLSSMKQIYKSIIIRKPKASRGRSKEVYVLARGFQTAGLTP